MDKFQQQEWLDKIRAYLDQGRVKSATIRLWLLEEGFTEEEASALIRQAQATASNQVYQQVRDVLRSGEMSRFKIVKELQTIGYTREIAESIVNDAVAEQLQAEPRSIRQHITQTQLDRFHSFPALSNLLFLVLILLIVVNAASLYANFLERDLLQQIEDHGLSSVSVADAESSDNRQATVAGLRTLLQFAALFIFAGWLYRTYLNALAFSPEVPRFNPYWGWLGVLIPIINVWRPHQILQDSWSISDPSMDTKRSSAWQETGGSLVIQIWWVLLVISRLAAALFWRSDRVYESTDDLFQSNASSMVADGIDIVTAALAIIVIYRMGSRQLRKYEMLTT